MKLYSKTKSIFLDAGFNLRKWRTNDPKLREEIARIENEEVGNQIGGKVLGVKWDEEKDVLILDFEDIIN